MNAPKPGKRRGRPPAFNHEEALEKAMRVFWTHGYEGTSMTDLTEAMGINKPSLYGAFGSKEELFRKVIHKYRTGPGAFVAECLKEPTARRVAERLLTKAAEVLTGGRHPQGCLVVQGALTCGESAEEVQRDLIRHRRAYEDALHKRFEQSRLSGDLPEDTDTAALAKYVATVHQGMSVQATSGATKEALLGVAKMAMAHWPGS